MNFLERMILKKTIMNKIKALWAKYPREAKLLAVFLASLAGTYHANPAFHALVLGWFAHLPNDGQTLIVALIPAIAALYGTAKSLSDDSEK